MARISICSRFTWCKKRNFDCCPQPLGSIWCFWTHNLSGNDRETPRQRYGKFHSVDCRWSRGWDGEKLAGDEATVLSVLQYDIGIVKLAPVKKEDGDRLVNIGDPGVCTPFTIQWMSDEKLRSKWRTLAYPSRDCDDNPNLQMMEQTGEYHEKTRHNIVKKYAVNDG